MVSKVFNGIQSSLLRKLSEHKTKLHKEGNYGKRFNVDKERTCFGLSE